MRSEYTAIAAGFALLPVLAGPSVAANLVVGNASGNALVFSPTASLGLNTAASPLYSSEVDLTSGVWFGSAGTIDFSLAGTNVGTLNSSGFTIAASVAGSYALVFKNTSSSGSSNAAIAAISNNTAVELYCTEVGVAYLQSYGSATSELLIGNATNVPLGFMINGGEVARFAATTGNFLIGTTTDTGTAFPLQISGTRVGGTINATITNTDTTAGSAAQWRVFHGSVALNVQASSNAGTMLIYGAGGLLAIGLTDANTLQFTTNNIGRGTISSVGLWTIAAPTSGQSLILNSITGQYAFTATDGTTNSFWYLSAGLSLGTLSSHSITLQTNNVVRGTIAAAGGWTINAPTSGIALTVNGYSGSAVAAYFNGGNSPGGTALTLYGNYTGAGTTSLLSINDVNNTNGVNIQLTGNGATTPNKFIRVANGIFQISNSGYSATIMSLDDSGNAQFAGAVQGTNIFGWRNRMVNGAMAIDQKRVGNSYTLGTSLPAVGAGYILDRYYSYSTGAAATVAQHATSSSPDAYTMRFSGVGSVTGIFVGQKIEAVNILDLTSTTATFSVKLANSLLTTVTWTAYYAASGVDNWATRTQIATGSFTVTSTLTQYTAQIALGANALNGVSIELSVGAQTSGTWDVTEFQLEAGVLGILLPATFDRRPYGAELQLCQRYLPCYPGLNANYIALGGAISTTVSVYLWSFLVPTRVVPTGMFAGTYAGVSTPADLTVEGFTLGTAGAATAYAFTSGAITTMGFTCTTTAGTPTLAAGVPTLVSFNTTGVMYATGCEL